MTRFLMGLCGLATLTACVVTDSACEDYADYICECHEDEYDCNEVRLEVSNPDADQLADCQVELDDLQAENADAGMDCAPLE